MKATPRLLIGAFGAAVLAVMGISGMGKRGTSGGKSVRSERPTSLQAVVHQTETTPPSVADEPKHEPIEEALTRVPAIAAFRRWADAAAVSGFSQADQIKGMEFATARAAAMKTLIQQDPVEALRQTLPAEVRNSLPPQIAAAIEQPVEATGMCAMRLACNHAHGGPHDECHSIPILSGEGDTWNAYYGDPQWETLVGQPVAFEGVAADGELAVRKIDPAPLPTDP